MVHLAQIKTAQTGSSDQQCVVFASPQQEVVFTEENFRSNHVHHTGCLTTNESHTHTLNTKQE